MYRVNGSAENRRSHGTNFLHFCLADDLTDSQNSPSLLKNLLQNLKIYEDKLIKSGDKLVSDTIIVDNLIKISNQTVKYRQKGGLNNKEVYIV